MVFRRRNSGFKAPIASSAWLLRINIGGLDVKEYCMDSALVEYLSKSYRRPIFVYPSSVCESAYPSQSIVLEGRLDGLDLVEYIVDGCREARRVIETLSGKARPSITRMATFRRMSDVEEEYNEAIQAYNLCKLLFGDPIRYSVVGSTKRYIIYRVGGRNTQDKRIASLMRIDEKLKSKILETLGLSGEY